MASIRDVAKHAGVSIASVSRVLNNDKSFAIKDETRQKIHDAIAELNYKIPEGYIKGNAKKFSIACIQRLTVEGDKDNYYSTIATGIKEHLSSYGKSLEFMFSQFDFDNNNYKKIFNTYPKGLIIMGDISDEAYEFLRSKIKYIVGVGTSYKDIDNIRYNKFHAGVDAVEYLVKCGHKKIAYIGSNYERGNLKELGRYEAYLKVLEANKLEVNQDWIIDPKWQKDICFSKTVELLQSENRPTAIFAASDHMAIAAISAAHSLGLHVPIDVSVIAISDIDESAYITPALTTVSIPQKEMGKIATETLLQRIFGDKTIKKDIYVPCKLTIRNSIKRTV